MNAFFSSLDNYLRNRSKLAIKAWDPSTVKGISQEHGILTYTSQYISKPYIIHLLETPKNIVYVSFGYGKTKLKGNLYQVGGRNQHKPDNLPIHSFARQSNEPISR